MTFEGLVDRLVSLFDVSQQRAIDVANERLGTMVAKSTALRQVVSIGTTVVNQGSYALPANVVKVLRVEIPYTAGTAEFSGATSLEDLWDIAAGDSTITGGNVYAIEADADASMNTDNLRIYPLPSEAGKAINGLVAIRPAVLTYTSGTALPIPVDVHPALLDGCKAELADEDERQDEAAKWEQEFAAGIKLLADEVTMRGKGTDNHRIRVRGYDFAPHLAPRWS